MKMTGIKYRHIEMSSFCFEEEDTIILLELKQFKSLFERMYCQYGYALI